MTRQNQARNKGARNALVLFVVAAVAALALALAGCGGSGSSSSGSTDGQGTGSADSSAASNAAASASASAAGSADGSEETGEPTATATVKVKGYKSFQIELYGNDAPETVANFTKLANGKYYDGLAFYRVVDGFCLQGGTKGNSASGNDSSLDTVKGEFSGNGVSNALADDFQKGTVAMARTSDPDSATSTFFITLDSSSSVSQSLNGQYAAFGVIGKSGMKVVDEIVDDCKDAKADSMGVLSSKKDMPIIQSIRVK